MSERVTMPALGESVTEGTVTRWLKNVGDDVAVDEPLLEVSTDKVDTEIPSPVAGTLQEILAEEDDTVPVGADLAVIGDGLPRVRRRRRSRPSSPTTQTAPAGRVSARRAARSPPTSEAAPAEQAPVDPRLQRPRPSRRRLPPNRSPRPSPRQQSPRSSSG